MGAARRSGARSTATTFASDPEAICLFEHDPNVFIARSSTDVTAIGTHGSNLSLRGSEPPTGARINGRVGDQMDSVLVLHELTAGLRYIAFLWAIGSKQLAFS